MKHVTRRRALGASAGASLAGLAAPAAAATTARKAQPTMNIERFEISPVVAGVPRISYAVAHGGLVHLAGVTAKPNAPNDVAVQTQQVLARIDQLLGKAGTDKSKLLSAQVWLTDMSLFAAHNDVWNAWVDHDNPPVRACLLSPQLWHAGFLVEIMVTAAR